MMRSGLAWLVAITKRYYVTVTFYVAYAEGVKRGYLPEMSALIAMATALVVGNVFDDVVKEVGI